jgi:hypothetical protein
LTLADVNRQETILDWELKGDSRPARARLAIFGDPHCPICHQLLASSDLSDVPIRWPDVEFLWIDGDIPEPTLRPSGWSVLSSADGTAVDLMQVPAYPFAYVVADDGRILAKNLVNEAGDIEELILQTHAREKDMAPMNPPAVAELRR